MSSKWWKSSVLFASLGIKSLITEDGDKDDLDSCTCIILALILRQPLIFPYQWIRKWHFDFIKNEFWYDICHSDFFTLDIESLSADDGDNGDRDPLDCPESVDYTNPGTVASTSSSKDKPTPMSVVDGKQSYIYIFKIDNK